MFLCERRGLYTDELRGRFIRLGVGEMLDSSTFDDAAMEEVILI